MIRPLGSGASVPPRRSRARTLIAAGVIVALVGAGVGTYLALQNNNSTDTASSGPQPTPTTNPGPGGGNGGGGNGLGGGNGGLPNPANPNASPSPMPTVTGGSGKTVSDPIDGLTIPVPNGWTATAGSVTGQGTWPALGTGPYTCPTGLTQSNGSGSGSGSGSAAVCTRGGLNFGTTSGTSAQSVATSSIATLAKNNYGNLSSHSVVNQGPITVAGRAGYQVTWSVVPSYTGPSGTVEAIAIPIPGHSTFFTLIDIGLDQTSQAPSLSTVNTQIVANITDSSGAGAGAGA